MNEDSLASTDIHAAIAEILNDYYAATINEPVDLKQRTWRQVAPWLAFAREGSASAQSHVTNDTISLLDPQMPQYPTSRTMPATIIRGIAVLLTLLLIALFVSVVLTTLSR